MSVCWNFSLVGLAVTFILALGAVVAAVAFGPSLVEAFAPFEGEAIRRRVPSRLTFGIGSAVAVAGVTIAVLGAGSVGWLPAYLYLTIVGVLLAAVDARVHRLPDAIVLPSYPILAALLGVAAVIDRINYGHWADGQWKASARASEALVGAAVLLIFFGLLHLIPRSGLGLGDVKLVGLLGAALGWVSLSLVPLGLVLGILSAGLWAAFLLATGRANRSDPIPYGPHLLLGAFLALLAGAVGA